MTLPSMGQEPSGFDDPADAFNPGDPSAILDLAEVPTSITLLQIASLKFRDKVLEENFRKQFSLLVDTIKAALGGRDGAGTG